MTEKLHQGSDTRYQIRIDGKPTKEYSTIGNTEIEEWLSLCDNNPDCYVDIVQLRTEILMSQFNYNIMKKHFKTKEQPDTQTVKQKRYN